MVNTGGVGQWQTGMTKTGQRIIQGQAWVGDRRTLSRGLGRENNPGTCKNQDTGNLTRDTGNTGNLTRDTGNTGNLTRDTGNAWYVAGLTILGREQEKVQSLYSVCDWVMVM